jgi:hypothetical protein
MSGIKWLEAGFGLVNGFSGLLHKTWLHRSLIWTLIFSVIHGYTRCCFATVFKRRCYVKASNNGDSSASARGRLSHNFRLGLIDRSLATASLPALRERVTIYNTCFKIINAFSPAGLLSYVSYDSQNKQGIIFLNIYWLVTRGSGFSMRL